MSRRSWMLGFTVGLLCLGAVAAYGLGASDGGESGIPMQRAETRTIGRMDAAHVRFHPADENRVLAVTDNQTKGSDHLVAWFDLRDGNSRVLFVPRGHVPDLADYYLYTLFIVSGDLALVEITEHRKEVEDGKTFIRGRDLPFLLDLRTGGVRPAPLPASFTGVSLVQSSQDRALFLHADNRTFSWWNGLTGARSDWSYPLEVQRRFTSPAVVCPGSLPDELYVHTMSSEGAAEVLLVSAAEGRVLKVIAMPAEMNRLMHRNAAERMALSHDGRYLVLNHRRYGVWLLDVQKERFTTLTTESDGRRKEPVFLDWAWESNTLLMKVGGVLQVVRILDEES